ncbi:L-seryl-tRNA(Sec) selenium transferase [Caenimonas koreensis]|uniref:L-seryl-tRNA(Sec) selenium transferase n=1 Tax=Caenimonas koreensis DSM 17982 TaxID=1121255 RepID=A0A844AVC2_9BURK|nr:L-seryl-tRNA(Sec) selenium transferase [Caenimonas koreensis]MRD48044.1 L-seryl-tRNA(Sec) selenium transferase [Caenimonas koreensis DSM 17982]
MALTRESVVHGSKARPQDLPSVDKLLRLAAVQTLLDAHGHTLVTDEARALLDGLRARAVAGDLPSESLEADSLTASLCAQVEARVAPRLRCVVNLTGTVIHTNMGRSVLPQAAIDHVARMMSGPNNLEYDIAAGGRGDRDSIVEGLLCEITGAQAATVVNNNAAAVLLTLAALSHEREAIVSRGELVEIGGAFRMPDVMASAGAIMVEVGTTNRTHLVDYARAIGPNTGLLLKVHTSNYAVQGFTSAVPESELAQLSRERGVPLATDLGSGSLIDMAKYGLPKEPTPQEMLAAGCGVVTFSGDKLLGGPQAGLIVGDRELVGKIRKFPMKRALRLSKLPLAALEATLMLYLQPELLTRELPTLRWLTRSEREVNAMAQQLLEPLRAAVSPRFEVSVVALSSQIGSGSLPVERLPSAGLSITPVLSGKRGVGTALDALAQALRGLPVPVIGRIADDCLLLDVRCLDDATQVLQQLGALREALA